MNKDKIKLLPELPGIYIFKDNNNNIIYIGKAKSIKTRVNSYFQKNNKDWKIKSLLEELDSIDHILTMNEDEAILLEAQLIKEKQPKFNTLLKNGQPFVYFLFTHDPIPELKIVRNKKEKGTYIGPFLKKQEARKVHEYLIRTFKLRVCSQKNLQLTGCLNYHIGLCTGNCTSKFDLEEHNFRINLAMELLNGKKYEDLKKLISDEIELSNKKLFFERSKNLHEYLHNLTRIIEVINTHFYENKFANEIAYVSSDMSKQKIMPSYIGRSLQAFLDLKKEPVTIDCFDISHFQSRYIVGACVRFTNGVPEKNKFRKFKIKTLEIQNDYAALQEIVTRRYKNNDDLPDLILIDGGKGQLNAVKHLYPNTDFVSLAKKEEILFGSDQKDGLKLDVKTEEGKLLIALRDYAHHFAINYHRKRQSLNHFK